MSRLRSALCAVTLLSCAACDSPARSAETAPQSMQGARRAPRNVRLAPVAQRELARTLTVTGTLAADEQVTLSAHVDGRLESISVDLGSRVEQGQVIAQIETTDYRLRVEQAASLLAQARARLGLDPQGTDTALDIEQTSLVKEAHATLDEATANLERSRTLVEQRLIARAEYDTARATQLRAETALQNAREEIRNRLALLRQRSSELQLAKKQLADSTVRAPLSGMVQSRVASAGEFVAVGAPIVTLVRIDPLRLRAEVPERDAGSVQVGQTVRFAIEGQSERFEGRVARVAPTLAEQSRTLVVEAEIRNPGTLRPGSFARAEIVLEGAEPALGVPPAAIVTFAGIDKVLLVDAGKAVEQHVVLGRRVDDFVEVLSGLRAGQSVVLEPGNLQQGEPVSVIER
jgi:RND family efflux transporter MFP subunit